MDSKAPAEQKKCTKLDSIIDNKYRSEIPEIVEMVTNSCTEKGCFDHLDAAVIPSKESLIEIIDLINVEDINRIEQVIGGLATMEEFEGEPLLLSFGSAGEINEEGLSVISPELVSLEARIRAIESEVKDLGKVQKVLSGLYSGIFQGFIIGFVIILVVALLS